MESRTPSSFSYATGCGKVWEGSTFAISALTATRPSDRHRREASVLGKPERHKAAPIRELGR